MTTSMEQGTQRNITYRYGAGIVAAAIGTGFLILSFYTSTDLLSDEIQWHLWSTSLPLIIPNVIMKTIWWALLAISIFCLFATSLPKATIILSTSNIAVQNPLTRSFTTITFDEVIDFTVTDHSLFLVDRNNRKIVITKLYLSRRDYKEITALLVQRIQRSRQGAAT